MEVRWTDTAADDLVHLHEFIARNSPLVAREVAARLVEAVAILGTFPESGRIVPERQEPALRELIRPPYRVVYEIRGSVVFVLTIFHSARRFPESLGGPAR